MTRDHIMKNIDIFFIAGTMVVAGIIGAIYLPGIHDAHADPRAERQIQTTAHVARHEDHTKAPDASDIQNGFSPEKISGLFARIDNNHDGSISFDEIMTYRMSDFRKKVEDRMKAAFDKTDASHDGKISQDEFARRVEKEYRLHEDFMKHRGDAPKP